MSFFDRFKKKDTPSNAESSTLISMSSSGSEISPEQNLQNEIREKSLQSAEKLVNALTTFISELSTIEKLSNEDKETITLRLQTMQKVVGGQHSEHDVEKLDSALLTAIEKSLREMIDFGRRENWESALQTIQQGLNSRIRDEKEISIAVIALSILAFEAMNCFLRSSNVTIRARTNSIHAKLEEYRVANNIKSIESVTDPEQLFELQGWYDDIQSNEMLIKQNQEQVGLNKRDINNLEQARMLLEGRSHLPSEEEIRRVQEVIEQNGILVLERHNSIIERTKKADELAIRHEVEREKMHREKADVAPVLTDEQRKYLSTIFNKTEENTHIENTVQFVEQ